VVANPATNNKHIAETTTRITFDPLSAPSAALEALALMGGAVGSAVGAIRASELVESTIIFTESCGSPSAFCMQATVIPGRDRIVCRG
jgi:hypothetical protein